MSTQFIIDWDAKLPPSAQLGMHQADENAKEEWRRQIDGCILAVARRLQFFTVDDVIGEFESLKVQHCTHNLSAIGPRMVRVAKELKYMVATLDFKRSERPEKRGNLHRVWKSKMFTSSGAAKTGGAKPPAVLDSGENHAALD